MAGSGDAALRPDALLTLYDVHQEIRSPRGHTVHAVSGVSVDVRRGELLGLVGESGCGKTTTARAAAMLLPPTRGRVEFAGVDLTAPDRRALRAARAGMQMVFQDPVSSLNPRWPVRRSVAEPIHLRQRAGHRPRYTVDELFTKVGLDVAEHGPRRPAELSGGQCQRVAIARALAADPDLIVFDEAVSSLDVLVQSQILELLRDLRSEVELTGLFIAHDLAVVGQLADRVAVMYLGKLCEVGATGAVYRAPAHPYTRALLDAAPQPDPAHPGRGRPVTLVGDPPSPLSPPPGCRFHTRCPRATERCLREEPRLTAIGGDHVVACHHPHVPERNP